MLGLGAIFGGRRSRRAHAARSNTIEDQRLDKARRQFLMARYDAAATNDDNRRHWANADFLSADAAATPDVRRILRSRARYESANNSYARGIVMSLANACIGTGPRLQLLTADAETNLRVNREWAKWSRATGLAEKLRTMRTAKAVDGEAFAVLTTNEGLPTPILLDVMLVEADRVSAPSGSIIDPDGAVGDGIDFDVDGNPKRYWINSRHPGSTGFGVEQWIPYAAKDVMHLFRVDRPGQVRGIPELTPSLPLFAMLRRYTLASLGAAEIAANLAAVLHTEAPADGSGDDEQPAVLDSFEIERGMMTTLPTGWDMSQFKAEQPTTTYPQFKAEIINEIARALSVPYNVAAGNSSGYNYASGRLDHQDFDLSIRVERRHIECCVLDRILAEWIREAVGVGIAPARLLDDMLVRREWRWDGRDHVDPAKEASAQQTRLGTHTTTLALEYARQGLDWEEQMRQRARELDLMRALGIPLPASMPGAAAPTDGDDDRGSADEREEADAAA